MFSVQSCIYLNFTLCAHLLTKSLEFFVTHNSFFIFFFVGFLRVCLLLVYSAVSCIYLTFIVFITAVLRALLIFFSAVFHCHADYHSRDAPLSSEGRHSQQRRRSLDLQRRFFPRSSLRRHHSVCAGGGPRQGVITPLTPPEGGDRRRRGGGQTEAAASGSRWPYCWWVLTGIVWLLVRTSVSGAVSYSLQ